VKIFDPLSRWHEHGFNPTHVRAQWRRIHCKLVAIRNDFVRRHFLALLANDIRLVGRLWPNHVFKYHFGEQWRKKKCYSWIWLLMAQKTNKTRIIKLHMFTTIFFMLSLNVINRCHVLLHGVGNFHQNVPTFILMFDNLTSNVFHNCPCAFLFALSVRTGICDDMCDLCDLHVNDRREQMWLVFHVFIALKVAHSCCLIVFCRYYSGNRRFFRSHVLEAGRRTNLSTKKGYSTSWCYIKSVILFVSKKMMA